MQSTRFVKRGRWTRMLVASLASLLAACSSTRGALRSQPGLAQSPQPCNQTDSTVSCCLKKYPGQYERCGAAVPARSPQKPNRPPPPVTQERDEVARPLPTEEEYERWRQICEPRYAKCVEAGGASIPGRVAKETQCKAFYDACMRYGFWPYRANGKRCLGT